MPKKSLEKKLDDIYSDAIDNVKDAFKHHDRPDHDFRNRFAHTLRVMKWGERIISLAGKGDGPVIRIAILFHDAGWEEKKPHNEVGAAMAEKFLKKYDLPKRLTKKIVSCVYHHNIRDAKVGYDERIVMDADLLDEVGITAMLFDTFQTAYRKNPSYVQVLKRSITYYDRVASHAKELRTRAGKQLFKERLAVYQTCINELKYELKGEEKR